MTQSWEGKSKGNTLGYGIFIGILRFAGVGPAYFLLRFVSFYYFLFSRKSTKFSYEYFTKGLKFGRWKALRGVYKNYYLFGQTLIDKVVVMSGLKVPFTFSFDGEHYLEEIIAGGKGGILISAHIGNYEIAGYYFKRLPVKVNIVMVDNEDAQIKQYLESVMHDRKMNIIFIKEDLSHIYEISNALRNNELIAIHADRFVKGSKTVDGNFLGQDAHFPMGPFVLAATFKVPISYVFNLKDNSKHYHLYATPSHIYSGDKKTMINEALSDYIKQLEGKVKQYPEQWFNYYNFWEQ
jgi:predicted LPLAT superfamily acyltransferase